MSDEPVHSTQSAIIARLRAAGCVFAEDEAALLVGAAGSAAELETMVGRRVNGLPLEQILGWAEFRGLRIALDPGVFVPRQRTGFLVEQAAELVRFARRTGATPVVADLCCGSGAVGAALAAECAPIELYAADIEPAAVRCARRNLAGAGGRVFEGDLYDPLPADLRGRINVLVANAPYVPTGAIGMMPPEARDHEPRSALDGGADGLGIARRIVAGARSWLAPGGGLLIETSERQAPSLAGAFTSHGLTAQVAESEDIGATVVIGLR